MVDPKQIEVVENWVLPNFIIEVSNFLRDLLATTTCLWKTWNLMLRIWPSWLKRRYVSSVLISVKRVSKILRIFWIQRLSWLFWWKVRISLFILTLQIWDLVLCWCRKEMLLTMLPNSRRFMIRTSLPMICSWQQYCLLSYMVAFVL